MVSFKVLLLLSVVLLAVAGPAVARVYLVNGGAPDASNETEMTTTQPDSTTLPESTTDDQTVTNTDPPEPDELEERIDPGAPPGLTDRSDREEDFTWTPVALVNSGSAPFEVYKSANAQKAPKRSGFRNVRTQRGSVRHSNAVFTQRPPPKAASLYSKQQEEQSYLPPAHATLPLEGESSSVTSPLPPYTQKDAAEAYSDQVVTLVEPPRGLKDARAADDDASTEANPGLERDADWRDARALEKPSKDKRRPDRIVSATGQVIQLIPFTLEDTVPRTTPSYFPRESFDEQQKQDEAEEKGKNDNDGDFKTTPAFEGPRKDTYFSLPWETGRKNKTYLRGNRDREVKRETGPSFISQFQNELSQDAGVTGTHFNNEFQSDSHHPNGAYSHQVVNFRNQTILDLAMGKKETSGSSKNTSQSAMYDNIRNLRQIGGQNTALSHRPIYGGFDRYKVPASSVRPKVGYNIRTRPPSNSLHHHHHDLHPSASINVGRYVPPPNSVQSKPKPAGHMHRHPPPPNPSPYPGSPSNPQFHNSQYPNPQHITNKHPESPRPHPQSHDQEHLQHPAAAQNGGAPSGSRAPPALPQQVGLRNGSINGGQYAPQQPYPKPEYRPGLLPHPAPLSDIKRPLSAHEHMPHHKFPARLVPAYGKPRPIGLRPQTHPEDVAHGGYQPYRKHVYGHDDMRNGPAPPGRRPRPGGQGPVLHGGPGTYGGPIGPGLSGHGPNPQGPGPMGHAPSGHGHGPTASGHPQNSPDRYAPQSQGHQKQKFGLNEPGKPLSTPQRNQYPGGQEDAYASATVNHERRVPPPNSQHKPPNSAFDYEGAGAGYDSFQQTGGQHQFAPQNQNGAGPAPGSGQGLAPSQHTFPFPTNAGLKNDQAQRDGRPSQDYAQDDQYFATQSQIRPTTIRPLVYRKPNINHNNNNGFSITEITQPSGENASQNQRPNTEDKPRLYGFPRLSTTPRAPSRDEPVASSSQNVDVNSGAFDNANHDSGYAVYEEDNYPQTQQPAQSTQRPRPGKYSPASQRGKAPRQPGAGGGRPRYRPRRPTTPKAEEAQAEGSSATAAYGPPPAGAGDGAGAGAGKALGEDLFTFAKTDYHGNVKWGVRHKVGPSGGGDHGDSYGH